MAKTPGAGRSPIHGLERAPSSEADMVSLLDDLYFYLKDSRRRLEYTIKESLHFLGGDQWVRYLPNQQTFAPHALDEWKPTPVTNYLVESFDYLLEIFLGGDPMPVCDPASRDQDDVQAAQAAQRALRSEFERMKSSRFLLPRAAGWLVLCGNAVLTSGWNGRAGDIMRLPKTKLTRRYREVDGLQCVNGACPMYLKPVDARLADPTCRVCGQPMQPVRMRETDMYGEEQYDLVEEKVTDKDGRTVYDEVTVGQLEERVINPLNWYPQPVSSFEECRYVLEIEPVDIDYLVDKFGSKARDVGQDEVSAQTWSGPLPGAEAFGGNEDGRSRDLLPLRIFRHVPDHRFKKGKLILSAGDKVLYSSDIDDVQGTLGYTHIVYRELPGQFWGRGPIPDLLSSQKRINSIDSHIVQNRKQMINSQWLVPEGAGIARVTGEAGAIIRWSPHTTGGYKPERVQGVPLPPQVTEERNVALGALQQIGGINEIMRGQLPRGGSGLETGAAVEFMYEAAYKRFKGAVTNWRQGLASHLQRNLRLISANWDDERLVRVLGDNGEYESYYYRGADLQGAESMIVRVAVGMQTSRVAYQRRVMEAAKSGLLGDIRQPEVRGRILEAMEIDGFDSEYIADAKKAKRVLQALKDGREAEPMLPSIDNHAVQFAILKDFILTSEYTSLPQDRQQAILQRAEQHKQIMQQQQQQVMQAAQAAKGTGRQVSDAVLQSGAMGGAAVPTQQVGA